LAGIAPPSIAIDAIRTQNKVTAMTRYLFAAGLAAVVLPGAIAAQAGIRYGDFPPPPHLDFGVRGASPDHIAR
jgi:hypothetical protein